MPISLKQIAGASTLIVLAFAGGADAEAPEWTTAAADFGEGFANAQAPLDPKGTLAPALLVDGTFYMDPVETPFGVHPYPRDMRVGVLSATKSLIPGLSAMRLAQKYRPEFLDTNIVSYFAEGEEFDYVDCAARALAWCHHPSCAGHDDQQVARRHPEPAPGTGGEPLWKCRLWTCLPAQLQRGTDSALHGWSRWQ
jgi:hypothetical protein